METKIKTNKELFNALQNSKQELKHEIDLDLFYAISFSYNSVRLQGYANDTSVNAIKNFCELIYDNKNNWLVGDFEQYHFTLTFI